MLPKITLQNITIKNNPSLFPSNLVFQIAFSNISPVPYCINWKIIYVGSALNQQSDQVLEQFQIPPIQNICTNKFQISVHAPQIQRIPRNQILCVTALIITASYRDQQFIRVGYYVHNQLMQGVSTQEANQMSLSMLSSKIRRTVLTDKPRITKFNINWQQQNYYNNNNNKKHRKQCLDYYFSKNIRDRDRDNRYKLKVGAENKDNESFYGNRSNQKQSTTQESDSRSII